MFSIVYYNLPLFLSFLDFGISIKPNPNPTEQHTQRISIEPEGSEPKPNKISNFIYQPYLTNVLQDNLKIDYKSKQIDTQTDYDKMERNIIMTMTNVSWFI